MTLENAPSREPVAATAAYVEDYLPEDEVTAAARARGQRLGAIGIDRAGGALLRMLTAMLRARAVVEVGTGAGVSGLYLLSGMAADGVLTSIDREPEHHRFARATFTDAGYPTGRVRLIMGRALDVLPRLTDGGYDLVFVHAGRLEYPCYRELGVALLRPGGAIVFADALCDGRVTDPARRDQETVAVRELADTLRDDEQLAPALLPVAGGMLVAVKRAP